jgi:hypothetical protein
MTAAEVLWYVAGAAAAVVLTWALVHVFWRAIGAYRVRQAGPSLLRASRHVLWRDPGTLDALDAVGGPGGTSGRPVPPFRFLEEHTTGSHPCVSVQDARHRIWRVKWGTEVRAESFAVRFAWSCGYFAEVTYFVAHGTITSANGLQRAGRCIGADGGFSDARFELEDGAVKKLFEEHSWAWNDNPFIGTRELSGLKIVVMLLSNWDTKDRRDVARGSNTAIFEHVGEKGQREARYLLSDWGGSMGRWGANPATRATWDVLGFEEQTPQFVNGVQDGLVSFGYTGQRTGDVAAGISIEHARWFCPYARQLTYDYLVRALKASGGTDDEADRFARAITARVRQLDEAIERSTPVPSPVSDRAAT